MKEQDSLERDIQSLGIWFQNFTIRGRQTAPDHPLGDYPRIKWERFQWAVPQDLRGMTVLEVGCNAGYYAFQMKERGADRVLGIDTDPRYLRQANFVRDQLGLDVEFRQLSVYQVEELQEQFDLVIFLGVVYHLRYPLLALDLLRHHVTRGLFVAHSMIRGSSHTRPLKQDYSFCWETEIFDQSEFPKLHFVENRYAGDPTNWWIPNRACFEAMLRVAGFQILLHPEDEVYLCNLGGVEPSQDSLALPAQTQNNRTPL